MQARPQTNGVVQWVVPPSGSRKPEQSSEGTNSKNNGQFNSSTNLSQQQTNNDGRSIEDDSRPVFDLSVCRTICTFIEEHLKELQEHQVLINRARSKLVNYSSHNQESLDTFALARNDICRLKVRDAQTNAIETIKRLTDYLRELSYIEKQCHLTKNQVDDNIIDKLSIVRTDIIQSLNDFVLSNSDIDIPIICSGDNYFDYDLCTDAHTPSKIHIKPKAQITSSNSGTNVTKSSRNDTTLTNSLSSYRDDSLGIESADHIQKFVINSDNQIDDLEKRKKEVEKLERETEELRRLFSAFYELVKTQGEQIDSIEENIEIAAQRISEGHHHLNKTMKGLTVLMPVTGCMAGALIGGPVGLVVGGKLGGITIGCASSLLGLLSSYSIQRCISTSRIKND